MTPKEKLKEIEEGKNDIYNFWSVRGYEEVRHILCMNITFHKKQKYESLGLSLQYLEQFKEQIIKAEQERIIKIIKKCGLDKATGILSQEYMIDKIKLQILGEK